MASTETLRKLIIGIGSAPTPEVKAAAVEQALDELNGIIVDIDEHRSKLKESINQQIQALTEIDEVLKDQA